MPKPRFIITESDKDFAERWINNQLIQFDFPHRCPKENSIAKDELIGINQASKVNSWCEAHMDKVQWKKLKSAIRAARIREVRARDSKKKVKRLEVSEESHRILHALAKNDGVSVSVWIKKNLKKRWEKLPRDKKYPARLSK